MFEKLMQAGDRIAGDAVARTEDFDAALRTFAGRLEERSEKLLGMLSEGPRTLAELVRQRLLYPPGFEELWIDCAETRSIGQHREELLAEGQVREVAPGRYQRV